MFFNFKKQLLKKYSAAENFNIVLKIALTILANNKSIKASKKRKCLKAALNQSFRGQLLYF